MALASVRRWHLAAGVCVWGLRGLLFVHGRQAYRRMSIFAYYIFYTNVCLVMSMFFYSMLAMGSATKVSAVRLDARCTASSV